MHIRKRLVAAIVVAVLAIGMVAVLAACDTTFGIKWDNYLLSAEDYIKQAHSGFPTATKVELPQNATEINTTQTAYGLITYKLNSNVRGHLLAANKMIGNSEFLKSLTAYPVSSSLTVYVGTGSNNYTYLYDMNGKSFGYYTDVAKVTDLKTYTSGAKDYLRVTLQKTENDETEYNYYEILEDETFGTLQRELEADKLPDIGETFTLQGEPLDSWLKITSYSANGKLNDDEYFDYQVVEYNDHMYGFVNDKGKETSLLNLPANGKLLTYIDGKILFTTSTSVDSDATDGYNFVSGSSKYLNKLYSFNIRSGKVSELKTNYVVNSDNTSFVMYNHKNNKYDLAMINVYLMQDGIARAESSYADTVVINSNGKVGYSMKESQYGMPMIKIGKNYVTTGDYIVNSNLKFVAYGGNSEAEALLTDGIVLTVDGKVGVVDYSGKVKVAFEYELVGSPVGQYAIVTDRDDKQFVLNLSDGTVKTLAEAAGIGSHNGATVTNDVIEVTLTYVNGTAQKEYTLFDGTSLGRGTSCSSYTSYDHNNSRYTLLSIAQTNANANYYILSY